MPRLPHIALPATSSGQRAALVGLLLCAGSLTAAGLRLRALGWDLTFMVPELVRTVEVRQAYKGRGDTLSMTTFLPTDDNRQAVVRESSAAGGLTYAVQHEGGNRIARYSSRDVRGAGEVIHRYTVRTHAVLYELPEGALLPARGEAGQLAGDPADLAPTDVVQSTAQEVVALADTLVSPDRSQSAFLRAAFDRVSALGHKPFKGTTDALTALRLGEASCNGRSRLLVALMRAVGIPARLVGGLVLEVGEKRTSHQWVEARISGHWIPFDATNDHFASLPENYLALYRGDEVLFKHTRDIAFEYSFRISQQTVPREELTAHRADLGLWRVFTRVGIPPELLKVIIMVPVGGIIVVMFRNVIGLRTFGSFLPVLIAASMRHTGFWWGTAGFVGILLLVALARRMLRKLELLHSPQLAVLLTLVIAAMLTIATVAADHDLPDLARISLFPFAILAITAERFALMMEEESPKAAWSTLLRTMVAVFFCHFTMTALSLQILFLGFPELLGVVAAIDIWLGRWVGLRMTEWLRFRPAMLSRGETP